MRCIRKTTRPHTPHSTTPVCGATRRADARTVRIEAACRPYALRCLTLAPSAHRATADPCLPPAPKPTSTHTTCTTQAAMAAAAEPQSAFKSGAPHTPRGVIVTCRSADARADSARYREGGPLWGLHDHHGHELVERPATDQDGLPGWPRGPAHRAPRHGGRALRVRRARVLAQEGDRQDRAVSHRLCRARRHA